MHDPNRIEFVKTNCPHFSFDTETKTWKILKPMNSARIYPSVAVVNGYIYVAGGLDTSKNLLNSVEVYYPNSDEWAKLAPMKKPRLRFALFMSIGVLYAVGSDAAVEKYDPWRASWTEVRTENGSTISISKLI